MCGSAAIRSASASARRDLPTPGSPEISTTRPLPAFACAQRRSSRSSLLVAADQRRGAGAQRLEAAERAVLGQHAPGALRLGKALQRLRPEIHDLEPRADLPARALGNHDGVRLGQRLQAGGEVGRFADDRLLLRRAGADQIADHHQPGGDADAHLQRVPALRSSPTASTSARPARTACSASSSCACG